MRLNALLENKADLLEEIKALSNAVRRKTPRDHKDHKGFCGAPDWIRTSGLPGRRTVTDRFKWRNRATFR